MPAVARTMRRNEAGVLRARGEALNSKRSAHGRMDARSFRDDGVTLVNYGLKLKRNISDAISIVINFGAMILHVDSFSFRCLYIYPERQAIPTYMHIYSKRILGRRAYIMHPHRERLFYNNLISNSHPCQLCQKANAGDSPAIY